MLLIGYVTLDGKICNLQKACAGFDCLHTVEISAVTVAYGDAGIIEPKVFHWELCCSSYVGMKCMGELSHVPLHRVGTWHRFFSPHVASLSNTELFWLFAGVAFNPA